MEEETPRLAGQLFEVCLKKETGEKKRENRGQNSRQRGPEEGKKSTLRRRKIKQRKNKQLEDERRVLSESKTRKRKVG